MHGMIENYTTYSRSLLSIFYENVTAMTGKNNNKMTELLPFNLEKLFIFWLC